MASNSRRKSDSSARSSGRRKVVISAGDTSRVRKAEAKVKVQEKHPAPRSTSSSGRPAGRRVADAKRSDRERRIRARRRMLLLRLIVAGAILTLLVASVIAIYRSSWFSIDTIEIVGAQRLSAETVREIAAVRPDATLLRFPVSEVTERLESDPRIATAIVTRDFPDTVRIRVEERIPFLLIDDGSESFWSVDSGGFVIEQLTPDASSTVMVVRDVAGLDPQPGNKTLSETVLNAIAVWEGISEELRSRVRVISAPDIDKTALITTDDVTIFIGSAEDISKKDIVVRSILEERSGTVVSINVRTVDRPTWRDLEEE